MERISEQFPMPPISKTNVPDGLSALRTPVKNGARREGGRRIQCMAALEKTLSKLAFWSSGWERS